MAIQAPPGPPPAGSAGVVPPTLGANLQQLPDIVVEQVPERLAQLARTIILSGTIVAQQPGGALVLRTQVGELIIRSDKPLPLDKVITLQIPPGAPPVRAQVFVVPTPQLSLPLPDGSERPVPSAQTASLPASPRPQPIAGAPLPTTATPPLAAPVLPSAPPAAPSTFVRPLAPNSFPLAALNAAAPIADIPLLPGTVLPAQVLAAPEARLTNTTPIPLLIPDLPQPIQQAQVQMQGLGKAALEAVMSKNLGDIITRFTPEVMMPQAVAEKTAAPASLRPSVPLATFLTQPPLIALPPGARVTLQIISITPPAATAAPMPASSQPTAPAPMAMPASTPPTSAAAPAPISAPSAPAISSPPLPAPITPEPRAPLSIPGAVTGTTPAHEPIISTPAGLFVLASKAPLPIGTIVQLSLIHLAEPTGEGDVASPLPPRDWPVLHQLLADLTLTNPNLAAQLAQKLPRPDAKLSGLAMLMLSALRMGDVKGWLGEATTMALRQSGKEGLLEALASEFRTMGQSQARGPEAPPTEWKSAALPLPPDGQLARLVIHTRQERDTESETEEKLGQRLLVEVELSRLGPMQFDGLIAAKRFDLTLRTQRTLSAQLRDELRGVFSTALGAVGYTGGLVFQTAADLWLNAR